MNVSLLSNPIHLLAFGFGSGLSPKAPGTFGTLAALIPWYFMATLSLPVYCGILLIVCLAGIYICGKSSELLGVHDHGGIVWDEFCGLWIALIAVPLSLVPVLLGFALFRVFDILKPWPIGLLDKKLKGGFGIMMDDILAGIISAIILQWALYAFPEVLL